MEKKTENDMETDAILGYILAPVTPVTYGFIGYAY